MGRELGLTHPTTHTTVKVKWTSKAMGDLARLHRFLAEVNPKAAAKAILGMTGAVDRLAEQPRIGRRLDEFQRDEVRRVIAGPYEIRYAVTDDMIHVIRLWHTREDR